MPPPIRSLSRALDALVAENRPYKLGFSLGQNLYTPTDTAASTYLPDDRPYYAWLYIGVAFHVIHPMELTGRSPRLDVIELNLGLVGPSALGEKTQNGVPDLIGADRAQGWAHQIRDEPGANLIYERRYRYSTHGARDGWGADLIPHAGASLGNVFTYANASLELRLGWRPPANFDSNLIRPTGDSNPGNAPRPHWDAHLFAADDARAVARDITLDGNTFRDSPSIPKKPLVADLYASIGLSTAH